MRGCQATTTYAGIGTLWAASFLPALRRALPAATKRMMHSAFFMANVQAALGISTLLYLVPVPLAACHQAGAVALLTTMLHLLLTIRKPSAAARVWRQSRAAAVLAKPVQPAVVPKIPAVPQAAKVEGVTATASA
jgi:cytochrome c oxidase assembly protein subunit 15